MATSQTRQLQVLVMIGSLDVGGTEQHLCQILPMLQDTRIKITVATINHRGDLAPELERLGVPVLDPGLPGWIKRNRALKIPATLLWLVTLIAKQRPDIVHTFLPAAYILGGLCSTFLRVPGRIMSRRSLNHYQQQHPILTYVEYWLHGKMGLLIGNSAAILNELKEEIGAKTVPVRLILNGIAADNFVDPKPRATLRAEIKVPEDAFLIVIVANLIPYKGHADLLNALHSVADQLPSPWRLLCVGRDDGPLESLKTQAKNLNIAGHIIWLGRRTDIADILCASDIGVLPSHEEGLSNAVLEGMAAGLPMVVTDVGGSAELVVNGETGLVVPAHMPSQLGDAIATLAVDALRRHTMGAVAHERVIRKFSITDCVQNYQQAYMSLSLTPRKFRRS